jgi:hypothetical protein
MEEGKPVLVLPDISCLNLFSDSSMGPKASVGLADSSQFNIIPSLSVGNQEN